MKVSLTLHDLPKPTRLDRVLRDHFPAWGRQAVQRLISGGKVTVNGRKIWLGSWEVNNGDRVEIVETPAPKPPSPEHFDDSWLIAEAADLIAVNKPAGLLVEPTSWGRGVNLRDLAIARFGPLTLFHRLDRDTSGVILLTRPGAINQYLDHAFKTHTVRKTYLAVVRKPNALQRQGIIHTRLAPDPHRRDRMIAVERGGQQAITRYELVEESPSCQLLRLWPETGRTHQLRVHLAHLSAPIVGDRLYGPPPEVDQRLLLHAWQIELPAGEAFPTRSFMAPLPPMFWGGQ